MFFSVVIPTYNPSKYLETLLDSITKNDCKDDIEVIIVDDKSTENFDFILNKYIDTLQIKRIDNTEHFGAPMMGRQNGANASNGDWICFADQDDYFNEKAFDYVKSCIENEGIKNYLITDFYEKTENEEIKEHIQTQNWTHGKFYQNTFWKDNKLKYPNTKYCEDICLSVLTNCVLIENKLDNYYFPCFTYTWVSHPDSLSKAGGYAEKGYFYKSFPDYIKGTLGTYISRFEACNKTEETYDFYRRNITSMILHLYFYFQGMLWQNDSFDKNIEEYNRLTAKYYNDFLRLMKWNNTEFLMFVNSNLEMYEETRKICFSQIPFIETETIADWINKIIKPNIIKGLFKKGA